MFWRQPSSGDSGQFMFKNCVHPLCAFLTKWAKLKVIRNYSGHCAELSISPNSFFLRLNWRTTVLKLPLCKILFLNWPKQPKNKQTKKPKKEQNVFQSLKLLVSPSPKFFVLGTNLCVFSAPSVSDSALAAILCPGPAPSVIFLSPLQKPAPLKIRPSEDPNAKPLITVSKTTGANKQLKGKI